MDHTTTPRPAPKGTTRASDAGRPIPRTGGGFGTLLRYLTFRRNPLVALEAICRTHGDLVRYDLGPLHFVIMRDPAMVEHVLVRGHKTFSKNTYGYDQMRLLLGNGLLTSQGDFWMRQRRIAQPAFHRQRIAGFVESMAGASQRLVDRWEPIAARSGTLDIAAEMMAITLEIVGRTLLSVDVTGESRAVGDAVTTALHFVARRIRTRLPAPLWVPTPSNRRYDRAVKELDRIVRGIIQKRRASGDDAGDLLSMFMLAEDAETGERMTDDQLRDEVMTMFLAGHETTAMNLSFTLYLLAGHPDVERAVLDELDAVLGDAPPTMEAIGQLELLPRVLHESMRLYPPAPIMARMTEADDVVAGFRVPKGSYVLLCPYLTHRHPAHWPDAERFDPDRFLPDSVKRRHKYAYFPFSAGQRKCIGDHFALIEAQTVLAVLLPRISLQRRPDHHLEVEPSVTLRPKGPLQMRIRPR